MIKNFLLLLFVSLFMNTYKDRQEDYDYRSSFKVIDKVLYENYCKNIIFYKNWNLLKPIAQNVYSYIKNLEVDVEDSKIWKLKQDKYIVTLKQFINGNTISDNDKFKIYNLCFYYYVKDKYFNTFHVDRKYEYFREDVVNAIKLYEVIYDENIDINDYYINIYDGFFSDESIEDSGFFCINKDIAKILLLNLESNKDKLSSKDYSYTYHMLQEVYSENTYIVIENI